MSDTVLDVRNLRVEFPVEGKPEQPIIAVDEISFNLRRGQILGVVGESGSGKSVTSLAIMGLISSPGKIAGGEIWFRPAEQKNNQQEAEKNEEINLRTLSEEKLRNYRGGKIAMIFQEPMSSLNPVYNIGFQIIEAIRLHQPTVKPPQDKNQAIALLQKVRVLASDEQLEQQFLENINWKNGRTSESVRKHYIKQQKLAFLKRYPHELSGGQLQRVMIAMAISCDPTILIADEPTTALDVTVQAEILKLLRELCLDRDNNMSMIFISHDFGVINEIADTVAVMYRGKIVEQGEKEQILFNPQHPYTKGLLACRPRLHLQPKKLPTVSDYMAVKYDTSLCTLAMLKGAENFAISLLWVIILRKLDVPSGRMIIAEKEPPAVEIISPEAERKRLAELKEKEALLSVDNLCVQFSKSGIFGSAKELVKAVDKISFEIKEGETLGLVGESGCGKSTLARTILRLIPATEGKIIFKGRNIAKLPMGDRRLRRLRQEMQIIFQNPFNSLNPRLTIGKAIMEPMIIHQPEKSYRQKREEVDRLLNYVQLNPNWFNRYPHQLSGGQRQRVCIARALALEPKFIICDESVSALDVSVQAEVLNLLKELQKPDKFNLTYIFISHDLSVVRFMSDRILVMNKGKKEELDTAEEIINNPQKAYTQKLIASIPECPEKI